MSCPLLNSCPSGLDYNLERNKLIMWHLEFKSLQYESGIVKWVLGIDLSNRLRSRSHFISFGASANTTVQE